MVCPKTASVWWTFLSIRTSRPSSPPSGPVRSFTVSPTELIRSKPTASSSIAPTFSSSPACSRSWNHEEWPLSFTPAALRNMETMPRGPARPIPRHRIATTPSPRSPRQTSSTITASAEISLRNLRLYSVFGPLEDSARLIPNLVRHGLEGKYPEFVNPAISRDFIFIDDVTEAFFDTALNLRPDDYGESFNIGTGCKTTIGQVAKTARKLFDIAAEPSFTMPERRWDVPDWYANIEKTRERLRWHPSTDFEQGLKHTIDWYKDITDKVRYQRSSKIYGLDTVYSVSAIVACYRDNLAIPIMYERLKSTFTKMNIDFEIIFVNDCSPDDTEEVIRAISRNDRRVIGVSHSRNFGSQSAFRSGMEIATKNACVLLDGDLQDPPELIEQFVALWREGFDVVFGRRVKREAPLLMQLSYKVFYRAFDYFSYISIPHDAGDFSLMDKRVVGAILAFPERDLFLRGVRAFAGFRQTGVDYVRPERMFGAARTTCSRTLAGPRRASSASAMFP